MKIRSVLIALAVATQVHGQRRRPGGGGGGGDDSSDSSGGGSGGNDPPDYGVCRDAQAEQTRDLFLMPGSYYSGPLTITHRVESNSAYGDSNNASTCLNNDAQPKNYVYDAVLAVGPVRDGNDTSKAFWSLQAFPPVQPVPEDARNEFVRLRSASYGVNEREEKQIGVGTQSYIWDTQWGIPWKEPFRQYWNTSVTPTDGSSTQVNSWDISATYVEYPGAIRTSVDQPIYPHNFITLSDICYKESDYYNTPSRSPYDSSPSASRFSSNSVIAPTTFFDLGASVQISGVGTDRASLRFTGGRVEQQTVHVHFSSYMNPYLCGYDETGEWAWDGLAPLKNSFLNSEGGYQNITVSIEMSFQGTRNASEGTSFEAEKSTLEAGPQWSASSGRPVSSLILLLACFASAGILVGV
jgi:hypothetical protein